MFEKYRVNKFYKNNSNPNNLTIEEFEKLNETLKTKIISDERFYQLVEKLIENDNSFKITDDLFDFISKYLPDNLALKLLENESFKNKFQYTHDTVKIINKVKDLASKEKIIREYYEEHNIRNILSNYNTVSFNLDKDTFSILAKVGNMEEELYSESMARLYSTCDEYFQSLPDNKAYLISTYRGNNFELFFDKLSLCQDKEYIIFDNFQYLSKAIDKLTNFCKSNNIDIFDEKYIKNNANNNNYFEIICSINPSMIQRYSGYDVDLFLKYLKNCPNKEEILINSHFNFYDDNTIKKIIEYCNQNNIDIFSEKFVKNHILPDEFYKSLPDDKAYLINYYGGINTDLFLDKLSKCSNQEEILLNSSLELDINKIIDYALKNNLNIYNNENFAMKYGYSDEYFRSIPDDKLINLIKYYKNNDESILQKVAGTCDVTLFQEIFKVTPTNLRDNLIITFKNNDFNDMLGKCNINIQEFMSICGNSDNQNWIQNFLDINTNKSNPDFILLFNNYFNGEVNESKRVKQFPVFLKNYIKYPELCQNLILEFQKENFKLTESQKANIMYLFNSEFEMTDKVRTIDDIDNIKEKIKTEFISRSNACNNVQEMKNLICLYMCNKTSKEVFNYTTKLTNIEKLQKMIDENPNNPEIQYLANDVLIFTELMNDILEQNDITVLKDIMNNALQNENLFEYFTLRYNEIKEKIRKLYELEAKNNLTHIPNIDVRGINSDNLGALYQLPKGATVGKYMDSDVVVIDFSNCQYGLYAHAISPQSSFFEDFINGQSTSHSNFISVSPISNNGVKYYVDGNGYIKFAISNIPKDSFIHSSMVNIGSNGMIKEMSQDFTNDSLVQDSFKESSGTSYHHAETLLYRKGIRPCGIIIDSEPTKLEIEIASKYGLPLIKVQKKGTKIKLEDEIEKDESLTDDSDLKKEQAIEELNSLKEKLLKSIQKGKISNISEVLIGASHKMYSCIIDNERYLLKPSAKGGHDEPWRAGAMVAAYNIQKLVYDGDEHAIPVVVDEVRLDPTKEQKTKCSAIKVVENDGDLRTAGFEQDLTFTPDQIINLIKEFTVDHLVYNYDTKGANFIINNSTGTIYGIDKEQALKFAVSDYRDDGVKMNYDINRTAEIGGQEGGNLYKNVFNQIKNGTLKIEPPISSDEIEQVMREIDNLKRKIKNMNDEQYLKNFAEYLKVKDNKELREAILARKNNIDKSLDEFIDNINLYAFLNNRMQVERTM